MMRKQPNINDYNESAKIKAFSSSYQSSNKNIDANIGFP